MSECDGYWVNRLTESLGDEISLCIGVLLR